MSGAGEWAAEKLRDMLALMREEIFDGISFFLMSVVCFYFVVSNFFGILKPVYVEAVRLYLDSSDQKGLLWLCFAVNFAFFLIAGYRKKSLGNLLHIVLFPLLARAVLLSLSENFAAACVLLGIVFVMDMGYFCYLASAAFKNTAGIRDGRRRKRLRLLQRGGRKFRSFATTLMLLFCGAAALFPALDGAAPTSKLKDAQNPLYEEGTLWSSNRDKLILLQEERFAAMGPDEKLAALQGIVDLEMIYFGIDKVILTAAPLTDVNENGHFDGRTGGIVISEKLLQEEYTVEECLNTVLHECFHAYEIACVNAVDWKRVDTSLLMYRDVERWREELLSYRSADSDSSFKEYVAYYGQAVEEDARKYAEEWTPKYLEYIEGLK